MIRAVGYECGRRGITVPVIAVCVVLRFGACYGAVGLTTSVHPMNDTITKTQPRLRGR